MKMLDRTGRKPGKAKEESMSLPTVEELFGNRRRRRQQRKNAGSRYKWVNHEGERLYEVGILADGTLHNPRGYPDDVVRAAVLAADARKHERRSRAAKKAALPLLQNCVPAHSMH